jgi:hypothetical protein
MPIHEIDPWRFQFFREVDCPPGVHIPTEDSDAWAWNPREAWVYDKLRVAASQGFACGPHGVAPPSFPVFSKPIVNLRGMGAGSRPIADAAEYEAAHAPGHFWMPLLTGAHVSSDAAVDRGRVVWWRHATGEPTREGMFDYWTIHAAPDPALEDRLGPWIARHLPDYTGLVNIESIGGGIIEVHLRLTDQWPDLYGPGWLDAVVALYAGRGWRFADAGRRDGFSLALFGPKGRRWRHPAHEVVAAAEAVPGVSSVQITFHEDRPPEYHSMPPGGFRLALVNATDLAAGRAARETLRAAFLDDAPAENLR